MKTLKTHINELYKDYPGKGWLMPEDRPKIKPKDIIWRSKVHHWDQDVRSSNTRLVIVKNKGKFSMYAKSDKSGEIVFHFGDKPTLDAAKEFASIRKWQQKREEVELGEMKFEAGKVYHQDTSDGKMYFKAVDQQKNKRWKGLVLDIGQKKPKNGSADEKLRFWKATSDKDIPKALKEEVPAHARVMAKKGDSAKTIKKMHPEITYNELKSIIGKKEEVEIDERKKGPEIRKDAEKAVALLKKKGIPAKFKYSMYYGHRIYVQRDDEKKASKIIPKDMVQYVFGTIDAQEQVETRKGPPQIKFMWKRDKRITESNKAKSLAALRTALAVSKYKKAGGKVEKQPPGIAKGALMFRGKGGTTRDDDEENKINRGVMSWKKLRHGKKKK